MGADGFSASAHVWLQGKFSGSAFRSISRGAIAGAPVDEGIVHDFEAPIAFAVADDRDQRSDGADRCGRRNQPARFEVLCSRDRTTKQSGAAMYQGAGWRRNLDPRVDTSAGRGQLRRKRKRVTKAAWPSQLLGPTVWGIRIVFFPRAPDTTARSGHALIERSRRDGPADAPGEVIDRIGPRCRGPVVLGAEPGFRRQVVQSHGCRRSRRGGASSPLGLKLARAASSANLDVCKIERGRPSRRCRMA